MGGQLAFGLVAFASGVHLAAPPRLDPDLSPRHCRAEGAADLGAASLTSAPAILDRPKGDVEGLLRLAAPDMAAVDKLTVARMASSAPTIPALADHLISAGGKRLRPLVAIAGARICGGSGDACLKLATAVEFIHTATLLHD